jgi:hypothetical protein
MESKTRELKPLLASGRDQGSKDPFLPSGIPSGRKEESNYEAFWKEGRKEVGVSLLGVPSGRRSYVRYGNILAALKESNSEALLVARGG